MKLESALKSAPQLGHVISRSVVSNDVMVSVMARGFPFCWIDEPFLFEIVTAIARFSPGRALYSAAKLMHGDAKSFLHLEKNMTAEIYTNNSWVPQRVSPRSAKGMVASKMPQASQIGADILAAGGNAIDAAVATGFAISVCEPWANGIGGGGYMVVWLASEQRALAMDFSMKSPAGATDSMFPMADVEGSEGALFGWPTTVGNKHVLGPHSICVPGTVAGLALALEKWGTMSLAEVIAPSIELAEEGFPVTWHITTTIAKAIQSIRAYPETASIFLRSDGDAPFTMEQANPHMIRQPDLANTLRLIAAGGPDVFYKGEIAQKIASHLQDEGTVFALDDLASYEARVFDTISSEYHGHTIYNHGRGTGGTSLAQAIRALNLLQSGSPESRTADQWHGIASVFRQAFADRFTYLADPDQIEVPFDALLSDQYAQSTVDAIGDNATTPTAGSREALGVKHTLSASVPEYMRDGSTTHLSVIDGEGNAVSLTQTLLALFGSRVTVPGTGILMNNGMMWFDPEPGRPNSIAGGKNPLSNMAPTVIVKDGQAVASLGASGGRKIMNCNTQLIMNIVDSGMTAQEAITAPRIDCSSGTVLASNRIEESVRKSLSDKGYDVGARVEGLLTGDFSSPVAVRRDTDGTLDGGADPWFYPATAIGVGDE